MLETYSNLLKYEAKTILDKFHMAIQQKVMHHRNQFISFWHILQKLVLKKRGIMIIASWYSRTLHFSLALERTSVA